MHGLHLILAVVALLIGIWLVCKNVKDTRSAAFWTGVAIILLSLCHLVKVTPRGGLAIAGLY